MRGLALIGTAFLLALAGCGNSVDHDSAVKVASSALSVTGNADGQVVNIDTTKNGGTVDILLTNHAGTGTAHITGTVVKNNGVTATTVDVTLQNWNDPIANVTLNGTLHEAGTFSAIAPIAGDVSVTGSLSSTGSVNATVDFDVQGAYSPTGFAVHGDVGGNTINVQVGTP
jgi:hypothetical protein